MRVVLQRVSSAEVTVAKRSVGVIGTGLVLLVGFQASDGEIEATWIADKVVGLRVFPDDDGKMNRSLNDVGGGLLVVSQFTLYGDVKKGRRPSFLDAAPPEIAIPLYDKFVALLRERAPGRVETGEFGALMNVELVNQGPVTILLER
ncbi:MAG TPA: D-tyrosyl-tRNA(Tyr) deacylase [Gemmatimonadetes bacterium]|nr:D-tyrosyl-tRNA(Tyr) deacylase [Gemmatimonadota bacterium]HIB09324.1 D-tyrosyl-tRNA(Tyr) deacylase [Gemmatimonadota bacterium]